MKHKPFPKVGASPKKSDLAYRKSPAGTQHTSSSEGRERSQTQHPGYHPQGGGRPTAQPSLSSDP